MPSTNIRKWQMNRRATRYVSALLALLPALSPADAAANDTATVPACTSAQVLRWRGGTARLENDLFAGTDRNYTNGVALTSVSRDFEGELAIDCLPRAIGMYTRLISLIDPGFWHAGGTEDAAQNVVLRAGQAMYTPADKARTDLIAEDRPYAGLLYLGLSWNRRASLPGSRLEMLDTRELTLGVIGPWSLARQTQDLVHRTRGIDRFQGWNHQLHNEPAFRMAMQRKFKRHVEGAVHPGWHSEAIGGYALSVGNIDTTVSASIELRTGWNMPNDFGSDPIRPGVENRPPSASAQPLASRQDVPTSPRPGLHVFVNLEAKGVARDFSLDGNLFRSSHRVHRRPWVAQAVIGIAGQWPIAGHGLRLALMRVWRSREFDEQIDPHAFGSLAVSVEF